MYPRLIHFSQRFTDFLWDGHVSCPKCRGNDGGCGCIRCQVRRTVAKHFNKNVLSLLFVTAIQYIHLFFCLKKGLFFGNFFTASFFQNHISKPSYSRFMQRSFLERGCFSIGRLPIRKNIRSKYSSHIALDRIIHNFLFFLGEFFSFWIKFFNQLQNTACVI